MNSVRETMSGPAGLFVKAILIILTFYILYIIYKFLYTKSDTNEYVAVKGVTIARPVGVDDSAVTFNTNVEKPQVFKGASGSDFSIDFWMYIKEPSYEKNFNHFILSIGGAMESSATNRDSTTIGDQSLLVYLTGYKYGLAIRTNTGPGVFSDGTTPLKGATVKNLFTSTAPIADATSNFTPCDIPSIDIQKWVHVGIVSSNKTLDVYLDGKLARSCILERSINLKPNYNLNVLGFKGFGGFVSNITTRDYGLNPEQIWRIYMAGPGPAYSLWEYIKTLFNPKAIGTLAYPHYPQPTTS